MKNRLSYLLAILFFFVTCKKEKSISTIYPLSFFPVYPGSFWKYLENDSDTIISYTSAEYLENSYEGKNGSTETVLVPYLDGNPIYQYNKVVYHSFHDPDPYYQLWPVLSDIPGTEISADYFDPRYPYGGENFFVTEKTDSTILMTGHWGNWTAYASHVSYELFRKNVGLYSYFVVDTLLNDTLYKKRLIESHINH